MDSGVDDAGARLCAANVPYGLAKIHAAQEQLGFPPDATFVASPDATITRNNARWRQGFGYGGAYEWTGDFHVLDLKINACGMMVGALPSMPPIEQVRERLHELERVGLTLDGVALDNDLTESNHFVDVFHVNEERSVETPPGDQKHYFIMHSSGHEHRPATARGVGLYWDESEALCALARIVETPWGILRVLEGDRAAAWYEFYERVQSFNYRRREALARFLFGELDPVINATHQGLVRGLNRANIGCYTFDTPGDPSSAAPVFPLTLSPTLPAFLVRAQPNISPAVVERLGWTERIERHGLAERIADTNLLPHGGGYDYPQLRGVARVIERGPDARTFELSPADPAAPTETITTPRALPYGYRGMEVKQRMEQLALGRAVVQLDLDYVLTA